MQDRALCERCFKPEELCVCSTIAKISTRTHVLILQHPQEPDKTLGTARLAHLALENSTLRVGLSWPNLAAAVFGKGKAAPPSFSPARWGVLYLGSGPRTKLPPSSEPRLIALDKKGVPAPDGPVTAPLDGLIVLDGTWSQAKTLWWRNAWLLKIRRFVLLPREKSLYGKHRREPKRECLSTLESVGLALKIIEGKPDIETELKKPLQALIERFETSKGSGRSQGAPSSTTNE